MGLNGMGFQVDADAVPITKMAPPNKSLLDIALHAGGDYELLLILTPDTFDEVRRAIEATVTPLTQIGQSIKEQHVTLLRDGAANPLPNKGYEHFSNHGKTL